MKRPKEMRPRRPLIFTLGSPAERWASMVVRFPLRLRIDPSIPSDNRAAAVRRKRQRDYSKVHHRHYTIDDLVTSGKPVQPLCFLAEQIRKTKTLLIAVERVRVRQRFCGY